jgi:autonomous glycyl radical cofactor GrcA
VQPAGEFGARAHAQLGVDVGQVPGDRPLAEEKRGRDFAVRSTLGNQGGDAMLGGGQPVLARAPVEAMAGYAGDGVEAMWDGAPTDFNIREDFPVEALEQALVAFAAGRGSSIMTITCANADTFSAAVADPEKYDLLRARMGGWTEFFVVMFPAHQAQHQRRPINTAEIL